MTANRRQFLIHDISLTGSSRDRKVSTMNLKTSHSRFGLPIGLLTTVLLATNAAAQSDKLPTLKDAYKGHFYVGVAISRTIATGETSRFGNRPAEMVNKDIALVKEQFNQISPENDLKWESIQPREGADGYNFGPADAYVDFGVKNHMYHRGAYARLAWTNAQLGICRYAAAARRGRSGGSSPGATDQWWGGKSRRQTFSPRVRFHRTARDPRRAAPEDARPHSDGRRPIQRQNSGVGRGERERRRRRAEPPAELALAANHRAGLHRQSL